MRERSITTIKGAIVSPTQTRDERNGRLSEPNVLSLLSHELLSPLNRIKGYTATLLSLGNDISEEDKSEYVKRIDSAADTVITLLTGLQTRTCPTAVHGAECYWAQLAPIVRETVEEMQRQTDRHVIRLHASDDLQPVKINRVRIEQVMFNLLTNAIKYSPLGGRIDVEISTVKNRSMLSIPAGTDISAQLPALMVSVTDHGIGIAQDDLEQVFNCFFRAKTSMTGAVNGSGLGLYICRKIVAAHGGSIWGASALGKGSTFTFTLPTAQEPDVSAYRDSTDYGIAL